MTSPSAFKERYRTYDELMATFELDDLWEVFDGSRERFNVAHECIDRHVGNGDALRIQFDTGERETHSFDDLSRYTSQFANALEDLGIDAGDRVGVMLEPSIEYYTAFFGAIKRGAYPVPGSPFFGPEGVAQRMRSDDEILVTSPSIAANIEMDFDHLVTSDALFDRLAEYDSSYDTASTTAGDDAVHQYSSGTTGRPTLKPQPHKALRIVTMQSLFVMDMDEHSRAFNPSPPSWGFGIYYGTFAPLALGTAVGAYSGRFDAERLMEALEAFDVDNLGIVPTALREVFDSADTASYDIDMGAVFATGEPVTAELFGAVESHFGVPLASGFGSTEVGPVTAQYAGLDDWVFKPGSLGKPLPGNTVEVLDDDGNVLPADQPGEIAVKRGGEWVRIGDMGVKDADGYLWHKGRADDVIISSGYTIGPHEVEDVVRQHEAVRECGVAGVDDEARGQAVKAFVELNEEYEPGDALREDIRSFVADRLSKHEYPREIDFVDRLPMTDAGKIKRHELAGRD